jgi:hypothetical protein
MFITAFVVCLRGYFLVLVPYATFFFQVSLFFVFTFGCHSRWRTCSSVRRSTPWRRLLTSVGQMWGEKHTTTYYLDHFIIFILVSTYKYFVVYSLPKSADIISHASFRYIYILSCVVLLFSDKCIPGIHRSEPERSHFWENVVFRWVVWVPYMLTR